MRQAEDGVEGVLRETTCPTPDKCTRPHPMRVPLRKQNSSNISRNTGTIVNFISSTNGSASKQEVLLWLDFPICDRTTRMPHLPAVRMDRRTSRTNAQSVWASASKPRASRPVSSMSRAAGTIPAKRVIYFVPKLQKCYPVVVFPGLVGLRNTKARRGSKKFKSVQASFYSRITGGQDHKATTWICGIETKSRNFGTR